MPAKWPLFINNVSAKLASRSAKSMGLPPDTPGIGDFAKFLADEYVNAVATAQTPFGNTHSNAGIKTVLVAGFDKAFKKLYTDYTTSLEDRKYLSQYQSITEILPEADLTFDAHCEIEKWTSENTDTLQKFNFYPLYKSTCPVPYPEEDPNDTTNDGDIDFSVVTKASSDINSQSHNYVVRFIIKKFNPEQSFKIRYTINKIEQPLLTIGTVGSGGLSAGSGSGAGVGAEAFTSLNVPQEPGKYTYSFKEILDLSGETSIKKINRTKSITIGDGGVLEKLSDIDDKLQGAASDYPESITKPVRNTVPDLTKEERIDALANRILLSNDGTYDFKNWVDTLNNGRLGQSTSLSRDVYDRIKEIESKWRAAEKAERDAIIKRGNVAPALTKNNIIPPIIADDSINQYIFQEDYTQRPEEIPEDIKIKLITTFTYVPSIDEYNAAYNNITQIYQRERNKVKLYKKENKRWWETQKKWAKYLEQINKQDQEEEGEDPYEIMAGAIIKYWQSAALQPFKKTPPIPPCNITTPLGGTFAPIYYGSKSMLANDLRRAWNNGKFFDVPASTPVAAKLVATAVAGACAKHLLQLKFLYLGGISTPGGPIPMIGFMPVAF